MCFPGDGPNVVVQKMTLVVEGRPDIEIDLTGRPFQQHCVDKSKTETLC